MEKWYSKFKFKEDPLSYKPNFKNAIHGYDALLKELFYRINSGNMIFLEGEVGKTSLLYSIINKYKGRGRVAYIDCSNLNNELNIKEILANGKKSIKTKFSSKPKNMIVLLDNINKLSEKNAEMIKFYFDQDDIKSIIMTSTNYQDSNIPESIKHRIGNRVYTTKNLTKDEIVQIILERLKYSTIINQSQVEKIVYSNYKQGIKEILQEVSAAFLLMMNAHEEKMTDGIIKRLLHMPQDERKAYDLD